MPGRTLKEVDELQKEINEYRPLSRNALKQVKEYYRSLSLESMTGVTITIIGVDSVFVWGKKPNGHGKD